MAKIMLLETEYGRFRELLYASCVARRLADRLRALGHEVIELTRPSPADANAAIERERPDIVWWVGHGNETTTTLENVAVWIRWPDINTEILRDRGACAESCLTGAILGERLCAEKGCKAYLGYTGLYWFMWCNDPLYYNCACMGRNPWGVREEVWSELVISMHDATFHFVIGLAEGLTAGEAERRARDRFNYWIERFERITPRDDRERAVISTTIWCLNNDRNAQVLRGDPTWRLPKPAPMMIPMFGMLPLILGMIWFGSNVEKR